MNDIFISFWNGLKDRAASGSTRLSAWLRTRPASTKYDRFFTRDFYRRVEVKSAFKTLYSDASSNPKKYFLIAAGSLAAFYILFGDYGAVQRIRYEYRKHRLNKELSDETLRTEMLRQHIDRANDADEIERLAREKYNLARKDETVYLIK